MFNKIVVASKCHSYPIDTIRSRNQVKKMTKLYGCPVEFTLDKISGKWKTLVLWKLDENGTIRFGALRKLIPDITPKVLTKQLRELELDGLVKRVIFAEVPPRVEYSLTEKGRSLDPVFKELLNWGYQMMTPKERTKCTKQYDLVVASK